MHYKRFEDLPVWKTAVELARRVYVLTQDQFFKQPGDLRDQLRRASLSVSNNIAEGFERGSTTELIAFLYIARGSAGESRSMLHFAEGLPGSDHLKSEISDLRSLAESCSRQIRAWADQLQNTTIQGPRHLNDRTRGSSERKKRAAEFQQELSKTLRRIHPQIYPDPDKKDCRWISNPKPKI